MIFVLYLKYCIEKILIRIEIFRLLLYGYIGLLVFAYLSCIRLVGECGFILARNRGGLGHDYGRAFCGDGCYWAYHSPCDDLLESACHIGEASCELDLASIGGQSSTGFKQSLERCFANAQAEDQRVIQRGAGDAGDISVGSQGENLRWFESSAEDAEDAEDFLSNFQGKNKIEYQEKKKYRKKGGRVLRVLRRAREVICHKPPFDWGPLLCRPPSPPSMAKDPSG